MTELLTAAQMRAIEQAAIDSGEVTGLELMERAGRGVVEAIFEEWPELRATSHRAVVLCGPGNNGGDGFVVARLLKEWGWEVEVFLYGDAEKLPPDARVNYERWLEFGDARPMSEGDIRPRHGKDAINPPDVLIDAGFGTGLSRGIPRTFFDAALSQLSRTHSSARKLHEVRARTVAIDLPSGICSDSGRGLVCSEKGFEGSYSFIAKLTVSFHQPKIGNYLASPDFSGKVSIKDIGLKREFGVTLLNRSKFLRNEERPPGDLGSRPLSKLRSSSFEPSHKYSHGHALILAGGPGKTGAARLAARGALRIGAGLVTLGCPQKALWEVATHVTAIMVQTLTGPPGLREVLEDERINALCLGPGMGLGADTPALVLEALRAKRATVLDADALTRFERKPDVLFDALHENVVLTPHGGEFKRLFPDIAEKLDAPATTGPAYSKVDATREAAARAGCVVLFKGPDTVIAAPDGRASINSSAYERAAPWLATAGSGDVLAGFITGLMARGFAPMQAAETGAWLHTECALSFGPGLIAEDLPDELPKVFRALL